MDLVTLALAKEYTDKNRLAYTEPGADIEWDGNTNGKYYLYDPVDKLGFVKVSDLIPPIDALNRSVMTIVRSGVATEETASVWTEQSIADITVVGTERQDALVLVVRKAGASVDTTFVFEETGVYFQTDALTNRYVSKLHIEEIVHRIPAKYTPEVPLFDFAEMGLPAVVPDMSGTGLTSQTAGDFSEFENALKRGAVRVRVTVNTGTRDANIISMAMPFYEEANQVWQLTAVGVISFDQPTIRVTGMYFPPNSVNNNTNFGVLLVNCAMLQHFTM